MIVTDIMQDASEIVHYDNPDIPLYIRTGILSDYPDMKALCHWHEDIQLIYIIEGEMNYHINGRMDVQRPVSLKLHVARLRKDIPAGHFGCWKSRHG